MLRATLTLFVKQPLSQSQIRCIVCWDRARMFGIMQSLSRKKGRGGEGLVDILCKPEGSARTGKMTEHLKFSTKWTLFILP